jgi:hypothetical protein
MRVDGGEGARVVDKCAGVPAIHDCTSPSLQKKTQPTQGPQHSLSTTPNQPAASRDSPAATPIMAKFFRNSHPSAPAPTRKTLREARRRCRLRPKTATWASYLGGGEGAVGWSICHGWLLNWLAARGGGDWSSWSAG